MMAVEDYIANINIRGNHYEKLIELIMTYKDTPDALAVLLRDTGTEEKLALPYPVPDNAYTVNLFALFLALVSDIENSQNFLKKIKDEVKPQYRPVYDVYLKRLPKLYRNFVVLLIKEKRLDGYLRLVGAYPERVEEQFFNDDKNLKYCLSHKRLFGKYWHDVIAAFIEKGKITPEELGKMNQVALDDFAKIMIKAGADIGYEEINKIIAYGIANQDQELLVMIASKYKDKINENNLVNMFNCLSGENIIKCAKEAGHLLPTPTLIDAIRRLDDKHIVNYVVSIFPDDAYVQELAFVNLSDEEKIRAGQRFKKLSQATLVEAFNNMEDIYAVEAGIRWDQLKTMPHILLNKFSRLKQKAAYLAARSWPIVTTQMREDLLLKRTVTGEWAYRAGLAFKDIRVDVLRKAFKTLSGFWKVQAAIHWCGITEADVLNTFEHATDKALLYLGMYSKFITDEMRVKRFLEGYGMNESVLVSAALSWSGITNKEKVTLLHRLSSSNHLFQLRQMDCFSEEDFRLIYEKIQDESLKILAGTWAEVSSEQRQQSILKFSPSGIIQAMAYWDDPQIKDLQCKLLDKLTDIYLAAAVLQWENIPQNIKEEIFDSIIDNPKCAFVLCYDAERLSSQHYERALNSLSKDPTLLNEYLSRKQMESREINKLSNQLYRQLKMSPKYKIVGSKIDTASLFAEACRKIPYGLLLLASQGKIDDFYRPPGKSQYEHYSESEFVFF
ncbi:MAG: hypothetical protein NZM04_02425 [Methylacidiphilales bacterium]|nr:hypothetical protein [Candidatus Methylacidiphilales bacterium]